MLWQKLKNYLKHLPTAVLANLYFGCPSRKLKLIGITGTDGKTTTAYLCHHFLSKNNFKTGLVSSILAKIGSKEVTTGLHVTSPSPFALQRFLKQMVKEKTEYAVLETTSHAWDQFRLLGCNFTAGVLTNVTPEHLDYHSTFENYLQAKLKLLKASQKVILNADDDSYLRIKKGLKKPLLTYSLKGEADLAAKRIFLKPGGTSFVLQVRKGKFQGSYPVESPLLGRFNVANFLAAFGVGLSLDLTPITMIKALKSFSPLSGRMERVPNKKGLKVYLDFAHTPNGLKNALATLREIMPKSKKLIVVFGAAGLRDYQKRPLLGQEAAKLADLVVLTSEDPRTENPGQIVKEISVGLEKEGWKKVGRKRAQKQKLSFSKNFFVVLNRQEAINFAVRCLASRGDYLIACGKGHEQSMCFGKIEYSWSERQALEVALKGRRKR